MGPDELFLSHSDRDRDVAARVANVITRHGIAVWYSRRDILGAQQWHDEIGRALQRCDWFAVLLSRNAVQSKWVKRELLFALQNDRYENRIVPIVLEPCDYQLLSWTLAGFHMVDLSEDFAVGCRNLLRIWGIGYKHE